MADSGRYSDVAVEAPTAGTIFHKSSTFHYKTAWRMFNKIRNELMAEDEAREQRLSGNVEIDETSWGGRPRRKLRTRKEQAAWREAKTTVLGMVERGGRIELRVIASRRGEPPSGAVRAHVNPNAICF